MKNKCLMIQHFGAIGDHILAMPAVMELKKQYDMIVMHARQRGGIIEQVYQNSPLVHKFIWDEEYMNKEWTVAQKYNYLMEQAADLPPFDYVNCHKVLPQRYIWVESWPEDFLITHRLPDERETKNGFWWSYETKRRLAEGVNFWEEFCKRAEVSYRAHARPKFWLSDDEKEWLATFKEREGIPKDGKLLGWQYTGSTPTKWYPYFQDVMAEFLTKHSDYVVIGTGEKGCEVLQWSGAGDRYHNMAGKLTWRQSAILTSIYNLYVGPDTSITCAAQAWERPKVLLATGTTGEHVICGDDTIIVNSDAKCSPCYNIVMDCFRDGANEYMRCIAKIPPGRILAAMEKAIGHRG